HLLDAATGEERQNLKIPDAELRWFDGIGFSPDGRHLAGTTGDGKTYGWRREADRFVEKGVICQIPNSLSVAYSPDALLSMESFPPVAVSLHDLITGKPKGDLSRLLPLGGILAFSRDGHYLAAGPYLIRGGDRKERRDDILHVCEMASGQEVLRWRLPPHTGAHALAFAPDGRTLIAGMTDTTVLLWDVFPAARPAADDLPAMWADLDSGDARRAHRALASLIAAGDEGVAFLARRLQPIHPPDPEQLTHWIADLDSDTFAVRDKAMRALSKAAETARPTLVRARTGSPPLERRRRIDLLLKEIDNPAPSAAARAIAALEYLGTPAARRLLQRLGEGAPEARRTREARAACRRLARIPSVRP
ncbi:MAG TPA: WD40 repeat domain-containing protein, partial [Gemmataceae bacterium]